MTALAIGGVTIAKTVWSFFFSFLFIFIFIDTLTLLSLPTTLSIPFITSIHCIFTISPKFSFLPPHQKKKPTFVIGFFFFNQCLISHISYVAQCALGENGQVCSGQGTCLTNGTCQCIHGISFGVNCSGSMSFPSLLLLLVVTN